MPIVPKTPQRSKPHSIWLGEPGDLLPAAPLLSNEDIDAYKFLLTDASTLNASIMEVQRFERLAQRLNHLLTLCRAGANIVIFMDVPWSEIFLNDQVPLFNQCRTSALTGKYVEAVKPNQATLGMVFQFQIKYFVQLSGVTPLLVAPSNIPGVQRIVAGYSRPFEEGGVIVFCPPHTNKLPDKVWSDSHKAYAYSWMHVAADLAKQTEQDALPEWTRSVNLDSEHQLSTELRLQQEIVANAINSITALEKQLAAADWQKRLLTEKHKPLEMAVQTAFKEMEITIEPGPESKGDLIALDGSTIIALEVKSNDGATKEGSDRQCDRWVRQIRDTLDLDLDQRSNYHTEYAKVLRKLGIETPLKDKSKYTVKGIIVSNTYREMPLRDRPPVSTQAAQHFSEALQGGMRTLGISGITTTQLLGIFAAYREDKEAGRARWKQLVGEVGLSQVCRGMDHFFYEPDDGGA